MGIYVDDPNARGEKQRDTTDDYREGWDRIFGKKPKLTLAALKRTKKKLERLAKTHIPAWLEHLDGY
jgi:flavorubredoxin